MPTKMRRFQLKRNKDVSGVSGTGAVAEGVEFSNGMCAVTWLTPYQCVNVYANIKTIISVHGHEGATEVVWLDDEAKKN